MKPGSTPGEGSPPGEALENNNRIEGCEGQRDKEWWKWLRRASPVSPACPPAPCSLQPNSSLRSGQSLSSSQWKLAEMHVFVETQRNCVGPHTSSGCLAAAGQNRWCGQWVDHPISDLCPQPHPVHFPQVFLGSLSHLAHIYPDQAQKLLPQHCPQCRGHQSAIKQLITLPCPHCSLHLHCPPLEA